MWWSNQTLCILTEKEFWLLDALKFWVDFF